MDLKKVVEGLSPSERKVIPYLKGEKSVEEIVNKSGFPDAEVMHALLWLSNKGILEIKTDSKEVVLLGKNGLEYLKKGLPERKFLEYLKEGEWHSIHQVGSGSGLSPNEVNVCIGLLKSRALIEDKKGPSLYEVKITDNGKRQLGRNSPEEAFIKKINNETIQTSALEDVEKLALENLKKRKDIIIVDIRKTRSITLSAEGIKLINIKIDNTMLEAVTPVMLKDGSWKGKKFRSYDIKTPVPKKELGRRHPYNESMNKIRQVFLDMGFQEMEGPWVETAFWGMDSMWIAQDHPMRDAQDTFYLDIKGDLPNDKKYIANVKAAHENGYNTGSTGHTLEWDPEEAKKLIMRQHSTATTYRYLYKKKLNHDCKYFYIADNFRNETTDATHLPEFGQAEGFIVGDNLTLANLMGFVKEFYAKLGITKIRFKPTFNPYTEPSMEAHYYDEKMGGWFALINSGIFRPETLAPIGINKSIIAWGMGSSRVAAVLTGKKKLKELFGPTVDLDWIRNHKRI